MALNQAKHWTGAGPVPLNACAAALVCICVHFRMLCVAMKRK